MRRIAAALAVWFCTAVPAFAQDAAGLPLVGVLRLGTAATSDLFAGLLRDALAALGDVDGNNIRLDFFAFQSGDDVGNGRVSARDR